MWVDQGQVPGGEAPFELLKAGEDFSRVSREGLTRLKAQRQRHAEFVGGCNTVEYEWKLRPRLSAFTAFTVLIRRTLFLVRMRH